MHSSEPARKKFKLVPELDLLQATIKSLVKPVDAILRDPDNASDTCELVEFTTSAVAVVESQSFKVFVLDIKSRLFVTGQLSLKVPLLCDLLPTYLPACAASFLCDTCESIQIMTHGKAKTPVSLQLRSALTHINTSACAQCVLVYLVCAPQRNKACSRSHPMCEPQSYHHVFCPSEVTESQQLDSVIQQLASQGCKGAEPGVLIHCRGQVQQDVSQTTAQVQITPGCTISLAGPESTARCTSPAALSLHHLPPSPNNERGVCVTSPICVFALAASDHGRLCSCPTLHATVQQLCPAYLLMAADNIRVIVLHMSRPVCVLM